MIYLLRQMVLILLEANENQIYNRYELPNIQVEDTDLKNFLLTLLFFRQMNILALIKNYLALLI